MDRPGLLAYRHGLRASELDPRRGGPPSRRTIGQMNHRAYCAQSSSASRFTAGAAGFLKSLRLTLCWVW